jgi:hypothetical protein
VAQRGPEWNPYRSADEVAAGIGGGEAAMAAMAAAVEAAAQFEDRSAVRGCQ